MGHDHAGSSSGIESKGHNYVKVNDQNAVDVTSREGSYSDTQHSVASLDDIERRIYN